MGRVSDSFPAHRPSVATALPLSSSDDRARDIVRHELVRRSLTVTAVHDLTTTIRRVVLTGDDLGGFVSLGPADHVKAFFPTSEGTPARRDYTPAVYREDGDGRPELAIDFVIHDLSGPASAWAAEVRAGSTLEIGGPRGSRLAPRGYRRFVLIADESALPALARWAATVSPIAEVLAFVQSADPAVLDYPIPTGDRVAVTRIGTGAEAALTAIGGLHLDADTFVWAAGEAGALIPLRRHLRRDLGLAKEQVVVDGYWKSGVVALDHHAPLDPDDLDD